MTQYPPPPPVHEYRVETEDGRLMIRPACDEEHLRFDLDYHRIRAKLVQLLSEYEAEVEKQERAIAWQWKLNREIEEMAG